MDKLRAGRDGVILLLIGSFLSSTHASAQDASVVCDAYYCPEKYIDFIPPAPPIITGTGVGVDLLYGDLAADTDGDGIAQDHQTRLQWLASRFSPILRRNTFSVPWRFEAMLRLRYNADSSAVECTNDPTLFLDTWNLAPSHTVQRRTGADTIILPVRTDLTDPCASAPARPSSSTASADSILRRLWDELAPDRRALIPIHPDTTPRQVLYFDFPGHDEQTWHRAYSFAAANRNLIRPHVYAHPFLQSAPGQPDHFEFVIQYWFFYPFNDGGNNHEGDWEHINVVVTTGERSDAALNGDDLDRLFRADDQAFLDALRIARVDYFFHHFVMTVNYRDPTAAVTPVMDWDWIPDLIRWQEATFGTHPLGYIGADNVGLDQVLASGRFNKDSHGTYPFPGTWKRIGPLGATEKIHGNPRVRPIDDPERFLTFGSDDITLIPDWERVLGLTEDSGVRGAQARRRWFWLVLPVRWGFPVTKSPGGGLKTDTDLGNVAPVGPAFNRAWNRTGARHGYDGYEPYVLAAEFGSGYQDNFHGSAGWKGYLYGLRDVVPPISLVSFGQRLFAGRKKFFPRADSASAQTRRMGFEIPFRMMTVGYQPYRVWWKTQDVMGDRIAARPHPEIEAFLSNNAGSTVDAASVVMANSNSSLGFHISTQMGRFSNENGFFRTRSPVSFSIVDANGAPLSTVTGYRTDYLLTGSLMHAFIRGPVAPFIRFGYGWNWWRLDDLRMGGTPLLDPSDDVFGRKLFVFPNTCHLGAGLEAFLGQGRRTWQPEVGIRLAGAFHMENGECYFNAEIQRWDVGAAIVVGF